MYQIYENFEWKPASMFNNNSSVVLVVNIVTTALLMMSEMCWKFGTKVLPAAEKYWRGFSETPSGQYVSVMPVDAVTGPVLCS